MSCTDHRPLTTFVIPNYNHGEYLAECLNALFAQRNASARVIFIDDASDDDSLEVARALLAGKEQVRIISHSENRGVVSSLNEGLALVDTPFVAFAAADDRLAPHFLEQSERALLEAPRAALAVAQTNIILEGGHYLTHRPAFPPAFKSRYIPPESVRRLLANSDNFLFGNVALYRTEPLREIGGFDASLGPLCDGMAMRLLAARFGFCFLRQTLGNLRQHKGNYSTSAVATPETVESAIAGARRFIDRHGESVLPPGYHELLARRIRFGVARAALARADYRLAGNGQGREQTARAEATALVGEKTWPRLLGRLPARPLRAFGFNAYLYLRYRPYTPPALLRHCLDKVDRGLSAAFSSRRRPAS